MKIPQEFNSNSSSSRLVVLSIVNKSMTDKQAQFNTENVQLLITKVTARLNSYTYKLGSVQYRARKSIPKASIKYNVHCTKALTT